MTKAELIYSIAKEAEISKASAEKAVYAFTNSVTKRELLSRDNLAEGGKTIYGLGARNS